MKRAQETKLEVAQNADATMDVKGYETGQERKLKYIRETDESRA